MNQTKFAQLAYIALGSNLGEREAYLTKAIEYLHVHEQIEVLRCSTVYQTKPVGVLDQPQFLNMVIAVRTTLDAHSLFHVMMSTEQALGRKRVTHWGPRTIDLDLLWHGDETHHSEQLTVPHPHMYKRSFVLVPLLEILKVIEPEKAQGIETHLHRLPDREDIESWMTIAWPTASGLSVN